jgi:cyclic beta-1,2-glucan synthetase
MSASEASTTVPTTPTEIPLVWGEDKAIRAELCGPENLNERARTLAAMVRWRPGSHAEPLLRRLRGNHAFLDAAHREIADAAHNQEPLSADAEWLLDNYYIIADVFRQVLHDLPRGYYAQLPVLAEGILAGWPRAYDLAVSLIAYTDSFLQDEQIVQFVHAYQEVAPLTIGELWAIPTMLRLALLENLRHLAGQMLRTRADRQEAMLWAQKLAVEGPVPELPAVPRDAFVLALQQAVRDLGTPAEPLYHWLARHRIELDEVMQREHQRQAANQVSIGNCVTSLRLINVLDWSVFFEKVSLVEETLRSEASGVYARQDFATRDRYRQAVEQLARGSNRPELDVARYVVARAGSATERLQRHVGWYLIGEGRGQLDKHLGYRPKLGARLRNWLLAYPDAIYFGLLTFLVAGISTAALSQAENTTWWVTILVALAVLLPVSELAVGLTNYLICKLVPPRVLPKLDFKDGIAPDCATFVVIPGLLMRSDSAAQLLQRLEMHYLANPDPQLWFALLTDFADAPAERMPEDEAFVQSALEGVRRLNRRYAADGPDRFYLFHRSRRWNALEGCWMGWERKRGKLDEFNRLLRGASDSSYAVRSGAIAALPHFRYVLTLDADTVLPREAAQHMVSALAHPLNHPVLDADGRRVRAGYAILQPRVSFLFRTGLRSLFARIFARSAGVDPYSSAVSDTYMDLFGRGTFTGKGLYDVDAFAATAGRAFPENRILSHDLIESNFARCALATDIEVFDDFPAKYHAFSRREHRWVRGDWQLLPWLGRQVPRNSGPGAGGSEQKKTNDSSLAAAPCSRPTIPNVLPLLERWKVLDNLRRSLVPPALVLMLILGWTVLPGSALGWTLLALAVVGLPLLLHVVDSAAGLVRGTSPRALWKQARITTAASLGQVVLTLTFLAHQAHTMLDAVVRTLARVCVSRRRMLEWETAAAAERRLGDSFGRFIQLMWPASALAVLVALLVFQTAPSSLAVALPSLALWLASPVVAWYVSWPLPRTEPVVSEGGLRELRGIARKTWGFFETFVTAADNWLPPDNFQEEPKGQVAHRTSPTNIGLWLLSGLAAHDLGFQTLPQLLTRLGQTFEALGKLDRHHGHFLNWYDTQLLKPLQPAYVSSVDSGNLLGCLWALKRGLLEKLDEPLPSPAVLTGLLTTLQQVIAEVESLENPQKAASDAWRTLEQELLKLQSILAVPPADLPAWDQLLAQAEHTAQAAAQETRGLGDMLSAMPERLMRWIGHLVEEIRQRRSELRALAPWLAEVPNMSPELRHKLGPPASVVQWSKRLAEIVAQQSAELSSAQWVDLLEASAVHSWADDLRALADQAEAWASAMDFRFLYNPHRNLFSVGYNVNLGRLDPAHYDLLASEACLTSFLAIARGDAPRKHWFQLGRLCIEIGGRPGLVSWGGTMFEYLMPRLLLPTAPETLLDTAQRTAVVAQVQYGRRHGKPWGISESAFYYLDNHRDYQYQSFGVPGLGLKRDLGQDHVVAPYATLLAVGIAPNEVLANLARIRAEGGEGPFGFYEAIDYTPDRLPKNHTREVVRSYMAHHQGMALVALANRLTGNAMPRRLHGEASVRAAELLLEERVPYDAPLTVTGQSEAGGRTTMTAAYPVSRRLTSADTPAPRTHLLSNGQYTVLLTNSGAGVSSCAGLDITRWRADVTRDNWGQFIYIRDLDPLGPRLGGRAWWSCSFQPALTRPQSYEVVYSIDKAEFRRVDNEIESVLEIAVAPDKNVEIRRLTLHNLSPLPRELELTSYAEVVLNPHAADMAHPAFGKLFLETEWLPAASALLCRRRPRWEDQKPVCALHLVVGDHTAVGPVAHETDRARFLGRRRTPADPAALDENAAELSGTTGPVLDPIFCLRRRVQLEPGGRSVVTFITGMAENRDDALALADQYRTSSAVTRALELAWAHARVELRDLRISVEDAHLYQRLAGHVLFPSAALRARPDVVAANQQGQSSLWRYGISGDLPIMLVRLTDGKDMPLLEQLLAAHVYWRGRGLQVDLVVLNEDSSGYFEELHRQALGLVRGSHAHDWIDRPGGIFVRKAHQMPDEDRNLLLAVARVVLLGERGPLGTQIDVLDRAKPLPPRMLRHARPRPAETFESPPLQLFNGVGGFSQDGKEYVLPAGPLGGAGSGVRAIPPAAWINVVANPEFGFLVSDSGSGFTWAGNSQTNRLTPWNNDPISDTPGEVLYLRDEVSGAVWSPTPLPVSEGSVTEVRHGQGYSVFHQIRGGLDQELTVFVPQDAPVKILLLKLRSKSSRRLSATFFAEWVLGVDRVQTAMHLVTSEDNETGALLARNAYNADFGQTVAFADVSLRPRTISGDRTEFLGRNRGPAAPAALERVQLSGRTGAALDPCAALQVKFDLKPDVEQTIVFLFGQAPDLSSARRLVERYRQSEEAQAALCDVVDFWNQLLGTVQVQTPDPALDLLLNRWLLYQVLSCRVWARSALYQSGGAYGFRDQLQDVLALVHADPAETRRHLLRAARHQFLEGDVQHWWHPPAGRGVRTRFSDDFLWLPFAVCHYVAVTGDRAILEERAPYLRAPLLAPEQEEVYGSPEVTAETGTLYEHCTRALDHGWKLGPHGLPLMGTGDWNDGMNKVGAGGKGESVWVAWFQISCLTQFAGLAVERGDSARAEVCRQRALQLQHAALEHAWDGCWYRRAYFDDGTPLGSATNDECRIDSLAQTWAVICGQADPERAEQAMRATWQHLVKSDERLILLFDPPFDHGKLQPGYIKGYVPGIRENGGQYTHAAVWVVQATALLGKGTDAHALFDLINPIRHASKENLATYRVEPYVVAADIYGRPPHVGRGGWTWYTGSASWLYRVGLETLLGLRREGAHLGFDPRVPAEWKGFSMEYRYGKTLYRIRVENPERVERGVVRVLLDDQEAEQQRVELLDDGREHEVRVEMG